MQCRAIVGSGGLQAPVKMCARAACSRLLESRRVFHTVRSTMPSTTVKFLLPNEASWKPGAPSTNDDDDPREHGDYERLAAYLLASLQMQHLLVLAGSGTSYDVGGPSMAELWTECVSDTTDSRSALRLVNYGLQPSERNIEELLSRCESFLLVNPGSVAVTTLRDDSVRKILERCRRVGLEQTDDLGTHKEFLRRLARRRARDPRLKLFTTNYDLCFERAAGDLGLVALDGFSFAQPRVFDPRFFDYDIVQRGATAADAHQYVPGVFQYFKLHGSVDWSAAGHRVCVDSAVQSSDACLVYPSQLKYQMSYRQPHLELFAQFLGSLRQVNTCLLVVGCGFSDAHLSEPMLAALESNPHLRMIVASPSAETRVSEARSQSWARLGALHARGADIAFIQASFSALVRVIPDLRALSPGERLERAVRQALETQ